MSKMYNYFTSSVEQGGRTIHCLIYRAPIGHCSLSDSAEHYKGKGKWELACRRDPKHPTSGHRLVNAGAREFPADGKQARAYMMQCARRERGK